MNRTSTKLAYLFLTLFTFQGLQAENHKLAESGNMISKTEALTNGVCDCDGQELENGSFESLKKVGDSNIPTGWSYSGNFTSSTDYDLCGSNIGLITKAGKFWQDVENVVPGSTVTLNIWGGYHSQSGQSFNLFFLGRNGEELLTKTIALNKSVKDTGGKLTKYTLSGVAPEGTLVIRVMGISTGSDYLKVDAACLTIVKPVFDCKSCTANKLKNPSFETTKIVNTKEVPTDWVGSNFNKDNGFVVCDNKNGLIGDGAGSFYQDVQTTPFSTVTLKIWAGYHVNVSHKLELIFYSEINTKLATTTVPLDKSVEELKNKLKQYTLTATAPAGTAYVRVKGSAGGNFFKVDAACLTIQEPTECVGCNGNLLVNSSFENTTGWNKNNATNFANSDKYVVCGSKSGLLTGAGMISQDIQVTEGQEVTLKIWGAYNVKNTQKFILQFYNSQNTSVGVQSAVINQNLTENTEGLKQYIVTQKAPAGTKFVRVEIASNGSEFRFDNACLTITSGPLPVTLTEIKVVKVENASRITWSTSSETNSREFEVQQSVSGNNWTRLGSVAAKGESKFTEQYEFVHSSPSAGENLYRLKMIDADDTFAFSSIVSVKFESLVKTSVYPNPAFDHIKVDAGNDKLSKIRIYNVGGILVKEVKPDSSNQVDLTGLAQGSYIVKISLASGITTTKRIQIIK